MQPDPARQPGVDERACGIEPSAGRRREPDGKPVKPPETGINCEKCGQPMIIRTSWRGPFLSCTGYPKCRGTKSINAELREKLRDILPPMPEKTEKAAGPSVPDVEVTETCPECDAPMKLMKLALFGSTGAALMSTFHQLSGGNSGSGVGSPPPRTARAQMTAAFATTTRVSSANSAWSTPFTVELVMICSIWPSSAAGASTSPLSSACW